MNEYDDIPHRGLWRPVGIKMKWIHWERMLKDVKEKEPEEACGLLAGCKDGDYAKTIFVIPTTNILHSPVRYRIDPLEQLKAFQRIDDSQLDLMAIYHSHPTGPVVPSGVDVEEAYYPEAVYLIWSRLNRNWICKGFLIQDGEIIETPISYYH